MQAKTTQGRDIDVKQDVLEGFRTRLRGPVFVPGDTGYEESRNLWIAMIDRRHAKVPR